MDQLYMGVKDVQQLLGVGTSKAYKVIKQLNTEREENGLFVIAGRIPRNYLYERFGFKLGEKE